MAPWDPPLDPPLRSVTDLERLHVVSQFCAPFYALTYCQATIASLHIDLACVTESRHQYVQRETVVSK